MKLLRATKHNLAFRLIRQEKDALVRLLGVYPRIPPAHHRISRNSSVPNPAESQRLLDEALAEQRAGYQKQVATLLNDPERFAVAGNGLWRLALSRTEAQWLLQVLNDIRVGSWLKLGSPADLTGACNSETAADYWAMEVSGFFQIQLLKALGTGG